VVVVVLRGSSSSGSGTTRDRVGSGMCINPILGKRGKGEGRRVIVVVVEVVG